MKKAMLAFVLFSFSAVIALTSYVFSVLAPTSSEVPSKPYYPFVMRLTGEIEFDGTVVPVNEAIACNSNRPETEQGVGRAITGPAYQPIIEMPEGRGWIKLTPGLNICRLYASIWAPEEPDLPQITPPKGYVPSIAFHEAMPKTDFKADPTVPGDGIYESVYFNSYRSINNLNNRLTIRRPFDISLEPFPPSEALLSEVAQQRATIEDFNARFAKFQVNTLEGGSKYDTDPPGYHWQISPWVKIIPEEIWRKPQSDPYYVNRVEELERNYDTGLIGRVIDRLTDLPKDAIVALDMELIRAEPLVEGKKYGPIGLLPHNRQSAGPLVYAGIPQPGIERQGTLYTEETARGVKHQAEADRIPFLCKDQVLVPVFELQGQFFHYFPSCPFAGMEFQVPGRTVIHRPFESRAGLHLYLDTRTMDLWYVVFKG